MTTVCRAYLGVLVVRLGNTPLTMHHWKARVRALLVITFLSEALFSPICLQISYRSAL